MNKDELRCAIEKLMVECGRQHHRAFASTNGEDPEWPMWYASILVKPLGALLGTIFTVSQLIYCLMSVEDERQALTACDNRVNIPWQSMYADHFVEHFASLKDPTSYSLALYHTDYCPFCVVVRNEIEKLGINVELRDIATDKRFYEELVAARRRATVPVLRVTSEQGDDQWMPESRDIIAYLNRLYGQ